VPGAVTLTAQSGASRVSLSWPAVGGAQSYAVSRGAAPNAETALTSVIGGTSYVDTAVTNGTAYYYKVAAVNANGAGVASNEASATPTAASSSPFGGVPAPIPGIVEAENFDEGGASIAYFDATPGNRGGAYRQTDVDIEATADVGGGYNVGWTRAGEWLQYTVNVAATGQYDVVLRLASSGSGGVLHLEVDGVNATGAIGVPNAGGWQAWSSVTVRQLALRAGTRRLRLVFDAVGSTGGVANVNRLQWTPSGGSTPYGGVAAVLPGTIEAENFDEGGASVAYYDATPGNRGGAYRQTDVDIETTADVGGGYDVGWTRAGEWLQYTADVSATGTFALELRVASPSTGGTLRVEVDGADVTGPIVAPNTGGWQAWQTIRVNGIVLQGGRRRIRLVFVAAGSNGIANVNFLRFVN
jgi:carbohydrate binding protein with CBM6 domain